jgi:hypothetical protein
MAAVTPGPPFDMEAQEREAVIEVGDQVFSTRGSSSACWPAFRRYGLGPRTRRSGSCPEPNDAEARRVDGRSGRSPMVGWGISGIIRRGD